MSSRLSLVRGDDSFEGKCTSGLTAELSVILGAEPSHGK